VLALRVVAVDAELSSLEAGAEARVILGGVVNHFLTCGKQLVLFGQMRAAGAHAISITNLTASFEALRENDHILGCGRSSDSRSRRASIHG
jgi:hypothetical protein